MKKLNVEYKKKKYIIWFDIRDGELKIGVTDEKNSSISSRLQKAILKNLFRFRNSYVSDGKKVYTYMDNDLKRFFDENGVEDYERFLEDNDFSETIKINSSKISRKQVFKTSLAAIYIALQPFSLWGSATQDKIEQVSRVHLNLRDNSKNIMLINDENDIKKHIENNTFLTDVQKEALLSFEIYDEIAALNLSIERQQELISLLQNLCVRGFDLEELLENLESIKVSQQPSLLGYVSPLEEEQNVIHLWDENEISTFYHEFVHVLQDCNYSYLNEPTAEIIASEFSDGIVADSYSNARIRVCVLMEIIGSEPVFEAVFKDSSLLEQKIHELLPDELDYNFFISHLYASPQWETDDASFDQLLAKMYFNKYHLDIKDDPLIQGIYRCGSDSGFYNNTIDAGTYGNYYVDEYLPYKRYYFNEDKMKDFNFQGEAYDSDSDFYLDATDEFEQGNIDIENPRLIVDVPISEEEFNRLSSGDDSIEIIDCYDIEEIGDSLNEIMKDYEKILSTIGEKDDNKI